MDEYLDNPPDCGLWPVARQECHGCGKRGRFYCPDCLVFVGKPDEVEVPLELQLPLKVDIVVTSDERRRSSGVQLAVVAPQSVRVVPFDEAEDSLPDYRPESDLVVFPSRPSILWSDLSTEEISAVRRIVLIDSRWVSTGAVVNHPKLRGLRHVRISQPPARSRYWRWHSAGEGHICTAEATYLVLKDFERASSIATEGGRLEDLLFLFALMSSRIKDAYQTDPKKLGKEFPASEEAKQRRRMRAVRLEALVKPKYKGLDAVREARGEAVAVEEFFRRRRGGSVYRGAFSNGRELENPPVDGVVEENRHDGLDRRRSESASVDESDVGNGIAN